MGNFEKVYLGDILVLAVNLTRAILSEAMEFKKIVEDEIETGYNKIVIDLSQCDYVDSTFFGVIVKISRVLIGKGYKLKIVKPAATGEYIFIHTNTDHLFDKYKSREDAIESFKEGTKSEH